MANIRRSGEDAQGLVEFAILLPILILMITAIMDFGFVLSDREAVTSAARNGSRYATTFPTSWSNASSAPANSIEGVIQRAGGTAKILNDDQHILISYLKADGSACGSYSAAGAGSWVPAPTTSNTQAQCVVPGALIQVQVTYQYAPITPLIRPLLPNISLTSASTMVEEL